MIRALALATALLASTAALAQDRVYGEANADYRIAIQAKGEVWVRVREDERTVFMRVMKAGDVFQAPNRPGLVLDTGNGKNLALLVDGKPGLALVAPGASIVRRDVPLDPAALSAEATANAAAVAPLANIIPPPPSAAPPAADAMPEPPRVEVAPPVEPAAAQVNNAALTLPAAQAMAALKPPGTKPALAAIAVPARPTPKSPVAEAAAIVMPSRPVLPPPQTEAAVVVPPRPATAPSLASNVVLATDQPIRLEMAKGSLIRLRTAATTIFVADPEIADVQTKSAALLYVYGKKAGETVVYAVDEQDRVLLATRIVVSHNLTGLQQSLKAMMPDAAIEASSIDNTLVLTGYAISAAQAETARKIAARFAPEAGAVVNQIQVAAPNQISLRVRIAEVSRNTLKEMGINWDALMSVGAFAFGVASGAPVLSAAGNFLTRNNSVLGNGTTNSIFGSYRGNNLDVNGVIDALATEGLISVLAEPNLTALSGETASFLAGGEFPIPIPQNANTITIEFKKFGVGLAFTPTLMDGDRINLHVRPEVSQLSSVGAVQLANFMIPALTTRRAETTIELGSGQSFAIAGLLQNNTQQDVNKVPFLGDVPVLGPLFRSDRFKRNETELVIIVTPYIVRPVGGKPMAAPTDGLVPPTDFQRLAGNSGHYRQQTAAPANTPRGRDGQQLLGPAGFVLD